MGWPTSFDSRQWRQPRILMPSVASLPEELLLLDPGAPASVLRGEGVCNKRLSGQRVLLEGQHDQHGQMLGRV
uniref:Uncharacterized protein n=1 Tax=Cebus imitator TaxID=2715852 RepID=A0A2K5QB77_CEBIM